MIGSTPKSYQRNPFPMTSPSNQLLGPKRDGGRATLGHWTGGDKKFYLTKMQPLNQVRLDFIP
jgi:hypothetical protein